MTMARPENDAARCAIVTGGGGGLGQAIATALSAAGYRIALFDKDGAAADRVAATLPDAEGFTVDITDPESVATALDDIGVVPDVLVNNAGITGAGGMHQPIETFRRIFEVNLLGAYVMAQAVADRMAARGSGVIVNITSGASIAAAPQVGGYGPSKAALANLTRALALDYAPRGVRVNAVAPGFIATGLGAGPAADVALSARRAARIPARALGTAEDVAAAVVFLTSDGARYIHGQELVVDGGLTIAALANLLD